MVTLLLTAYVLHIFGNFFQLTLMKGLHGLTAECFTCKYKLFFDTYDFLNILSVMKHFFQVA